MSNSKTKKLPVYKDHSLFVSNTNLDKNEPIIVYTPNEIETTAIESVFNLLFEILETNGSAP